MNSDPGPETRPNHYSFKSTAGDAFMHWVKRLLERNPFYLISAGLLLYGVNLFSTDSPIAHAETSRLAFNFSILLIYELLLVVTALFLSRRKIWYDSLLLVLLENLFVLVPFSLVSRALFAEPKLAWWMCGAGLLFAVVKFAILKHSIPQLNFPRRLFVFAGITLLLNAALPIVSHHFADDQAILKRTITLGWLVILPLLLLLIELLPRREFASEAPAQRFWPQIVFALWIVITGLHLGGVGYVHTFHWAIAMLAPTAWILSWLLVRRTERLESFRQQFQVAILTSPLLAACLALGYADNQMTFALLMCNACLYGWLRFRHRNYTAHRLAFISLIASFALFPESWGHFIHPDFNRTTALIMAITVFIFVWSLFSRDPKKGLFGALALAPITRLMFGEAVEIGHLVQISSVYLLIHSLRWNDENCVGANATRNLFATIWLAHSLLWLKTDSEGAEFAIFTLPVTVCAIYAIAWILFQLRGKRIVPCTAAVILAMQGVIKAAGLKTQIPNGTGAIIASFFVFAIGTAFALTKARWVNSRTSEINRKE